MSNIESDNMKLEDETIRIALVIKMKASIKVFEKKAAEAKDLNELILIFEDALNELKYVNERFLKMDMEKKDDS